MRWEGRRRTRRQIGQMEILDNLLSHLFNKPFFNLGSQLTTGSSIVEGGIDGILDGLLLLLLVQDGRRSLRTRPRAWP